MDKGYLIDTNIVIQYLNKTLTPQGFSFINSILNNASISVITRIELLLFKSLTKEQVDVIELFISQIPIINTTNEIAKLATNLILSSDKKPKNIFGDAIIAATAITGNLTLLSLNDNDFINFPELKFINPEKSAKE
jgi:predicted nucleic acid-binding protein